MILNLHEMFILDWIHECRQSSLGGFPVWSIVLGFVSHVLLVSLLLFLPLSLCGVLWMSSFSPPIRIRRCFAPTHYTGGELLSEPVHLLRNRSQVFHLCHCNAFCQDIPPHLLWYHHQISGAMLEAFLLSWWRCCLPVYPDLCRGGQVILWLK